MALHCADSDDDGDGEFAVIVGIGATSPYLHRDEAYVGSTHQTETLMMEDSEVKVEKTYQPLAIDELSMGSQTATTTSINTPLSILSPSLIIGTGGKAIDSTVLLRRATEVALSMYSNDNGGVDWFVSHSLEGTSYDDDGNNASWGTVAGGAAGVDATSLVRRVADMAQSSTQSLGGKYGRMLSSSLLAIGAQNPNNSNSDNGKDRLVLWRVDPTGQFWRSNASAVGRGSVNAESELLNRVRKWRMQQRNDDGEKECEILHEDVRDYLASLSADEAVEAATNCLVDGIMERRKHLAKTDDQIIAVKQLEIGLRKRVQAVVIRTNKKDVADKLESRIEVY